MTDGWSVLSEVARDEDGYEYATISFSLPDGVYAELEGGTYGTMVGVRVYREPFEGRRSLPIVG